MDLILSTLKWQINNVCHKLDYAYLFLIQFSFLLQLVAGALARFFHHPIITTALTNSTLHMATDTHQEWDREACFQSK